MTSKPRKDDVLDLLLRAEGPVMLVAHIDPDGDTMGSCHALYLWLRARGRDARIYCQHAVPQGYRWAFGEGFTQALGSLPGVLLCMDCASADRLGEAADYLHKAACTICIDHHYTNTHFCQYEYLDYEASSTAEIVAMLLSAKGYALTREMAQDIYMGLVTDTGQFSFENVRPNTLRMAALAAEAGADVPGINNAVYRTRTLGKTRLTAAAINSLQMYNKGKVAVMAVDKATMAACGATYADGENIVNYGIEIDTVEITAFLKEQTVGFKTSLRTSPRYDAGAIAARLGGGGHARAAGCTLPRDLGRAMALLLAALEEELGCALERDI